MNWERAKTLLIILFFAVAIYLTAVIAVTEYKTRVISDETVESITLLLETNNIKIKDGAIPETSVTADVINIENAFSDNLALTECVLGAGYSEYTDGVYKSGENTVSFDDGRFYIKYSPATDISNINKDNCAKIINSLLKETGFSGNNFKIKSYEEANGEINIKIRRTYNDIEINGVYIDFTFKEGFAYFSGVWTSGNVTETGDVADAGIVSVIAEFTGISPKPEGETVEKIDFVYYVNTADITHKYKSFQAIPAVAVVTDKATYYFDARREFLASSGYLGKTNN